MARNRQKTTLALITVLAALIAFFFGVSVLILDALNLSTAGTIGLIVGAAFLTALCIALCVLSGSALFQDDPNTLSDLRGLSSLQHPLLVRLREEAPGTYHHSLAVAALAEAAAEAIGADATLARVGGYYHDLGKLKHPELFIENIDPKDDPHHHLEPIDSARIIIQHVIDGIQIAKEAQLPEEVVNFIPEHTGTTLVYSFYNKAKQAAPKGEGVYKRNFRYPGPKPMSKETAIVMLADTAEAAVRAHGPETDIQLQAVIEEVTQEKSDDTQLDISGLTATDLATIKSSFFTVLQHMHHRRIKYPKRGDVRSEDSEE